MNAQPNMWHPRPMFLVLALLLLVALLIPARALAAAPAQEGLPPPPIPYAGVLQRPDGSGVPDGPYDFQMALYGQESGGAPLWVEGHASVMVEAGAFSVMLGESAALPQAGGFTWLEISVLGPGEATWTTLTPREFLDLKYSPPMPVAPAATDALDCAHTHLYENWIGSSITYALRLENSSSGDGLRVYTHATAPNFAALYAVNLGSGVGSGVYAFSTNGAGVTGRSTSGVGISGTSTNADGIMGLATAPAKSGVYGVNTSTTVVGYGVFGRASKGFGLGADGNDASYSDKLGDIELQGAKGEIFAPGTLALYSNGNVYIDLDDNNNDSNACLRLYTGANTVAAQWCENGTKSAVLQQEDGSSRAVYAIESPEVWLEDLGTAQLQNGEAAVPFEPLFAQMINTADYHVFVTPLGETNGLYVAEKGPQGFVVRELGGGTGNVAFDWRITAHRLGLEGLRAEVVAARVDDR